MDFPVIVYIEDNPDNARLIMRQLRGENILVIAADNGQSGIEAVMQHRPNIVLVDYNLPDMDGLEVVRRLRRMPDLAQTPMIMLTADTSDDLRTRALASEFDAYLTKPLLRDDVQQVIVPYLL